MWSLITQIFCFFLLNSGNIKSFHKCFFDHGIDVRNKKFLFSNGADVVKKLKTLVSYLILIPVLFFEVGILG